MGLFSRKDWNVVAVIHERSEQYQVNGQRAKGGDADKARDGAKAHPRTIYWAVFDQKGAFVEGEFGAGMKLIHGDAAKKLVRDFATNRTVQEVLKVLESGAQPNLAKPFVWDGYPKKSP